MPAGSTPAADIDKERRCSQLVETCNLTFWVITYYLLLLLWYYITLSTYLFLFIFPGAFYHLFFQICFFSEPLVWLYYQCDNSAIAGKGALDQTQK